jgi:deoxyribonuclease V
MRIRELHAWDVSPGEAMGLQAAMASQVIARGGPKRVGLVGAADVAYVDRRWPRQPSLARAATVVLSFPDLEIVEQQVIEAPVTFPYVPGLLSFREAPPLLEAFRAQKNTPDLLLVDGQGTLHPRRFGLACHLGLVLDIPTIGCAKSRLCGECGRLGVERGATAEVVDRGEVAGLALRTRRSVAPIYVSPGHRIGLREAAEWALRLSRTRVPEPIKVADRLSKGR